MYYPGGKDGLCVRLTTLPTSYAVVMKSGSLNFLEPSGPLQDCNGTALPLRFLPLVVFCLFSFRIVKGPPLQWREKGYSLKTFSDLPTFSYARVPGDIKKIILGAPP